jgi:SPP1 family phage portal protein
MMVSWKNYKKEVFMVFDFKLQADREFVVKEIERFKCSQRRLAMLNGEDYYAGRQDILNRRRTVIGERGELERVYNLPDNKAVDNQYRKLVNQKTNYLLGKPITFRTCDEKFGRYLDSLFDRRFMRVMKNLCKDVYNHGIAWIYPCLRDGELAFKRLKGYEVIPGWRDFEHTELDYAIRVYEVVDCSENCEKIIERVEVFDESGIHYFELDNQGELVGIEPWHSPYIKADDVGVNWDKIPLIAFKRDSDESPLINCVKSLQDGLNLILSNFWNSMEEDPRNTLLVLVNYDGDDLGEFRRNLAAYGAVKVRSVDGAAGDLKTLRVEVNADNYRTIIDIFKRAIVENGMGFEAKDSRSGGTPNQMHLQSMYSDIDLDANETETEFQASLTELMYFVSRISQLCGVTAFYEIGQEQVDFIFNRDMLMNESSIIDNCVKSIGILDKETIKANHPWS